LAINTIGIVGFILQGFNHRGLWRFCQLLGKSLVRQATECIVRLNQDSVLSFTLGDPYWSQVLASSFNYEPEIDRVLGICKDMPYGLIDCGANIGYWSVRATSKEFGSHPSIAIEASKEAFQALLNNCRLNHNRFQCLLRAVAGRSGEYRAIRKDSNRSLQDGSHAAVSVSPAPVQKDSMAGESIHGEVVPTITIDEVQRSLCVQAGWPALTVIKLDVEGSEIEALGGAAETIAEGSLIIYEDHGSERTCRVSKYVLSSLGLRVFYIEADGLIIPITRTQQVQAIKKRESKGYNFFACNAGSPFHSRLLSLGAT
jgi:FkbM family methyltransferase